MEIERFVFPLSRYRFDAKYQFYYAYGNTPAQDFLANYKGVKEPAVLVLDCGDMRSCFYSLWKNFDTSSAPIRFDGVHFVLNDISAAVLARNILFLYLCLQMPQNEGEMKKWLSSMWAIWYCHELYPEHNKRLNKSLRLLCKYSKSWDSDANPLYPMVQFSSPSTLNEIASVWKMWLWNKINVTSVEKMHSSRKEMLQSKGIDWLHESKQEARIFEFISMHEIAGESIKNYEEKVSEYLSYSKTGTVFAENVLGLDFPKEKTLVNLTLYEREDGKYNLHYHSLPFRGYHHVVMFSSEQLVSMKTADTTKLKLHVEDKHFTTFPFLSNSVQQFSIWLQSASKILNSERKSKISFTFDSSHALPFCYELENNKCMSYHRQFDVIYTSNLIDHLGPPNVILSAIALLKNDGLLYTSTFHKGSFPTVEEYLKSCFGFECKLLPVLLGIRCINHEGRNYANPIMVCPPANSACILNDNLLVWEKLNVLPLVFPSDHLLSNTIANALCDAALVSAYQLLESPRGYLVTSTLCLETAIKIIQVFMSNTVADFKDQFWKPLYDLMKGKMKPFLSSMQTQLFLHDIHMHLTVTNECCPLCQQTPLSTTIGLFCFRVNESHPGSRFMVFIHKEKCEDAQYLCGIATKNRENVHIFDCVSSASDNTDSSELYFYAPLKLVEQGYRVSLISSIMAGPLGNYSSNINTTQSLKEMKTTFKLFKFFKADIPNSKKVDLQLFGRVSLHLSDGDISEFGISISEPVSDCLSKEDLQTKQISFNEIELSCGTHGCNVRCHYPVEYRKISVEVLKEKKIISMKLLRASQSFEEQESLFILSPDNYLSLFPFTQSEEAMSSLCNQQFTSDDYKILKSSDLNPSLMSPLLNVKIAFLDIFEHQDVYHYEIVSPEKDIRGYILINKRLLDYATKSPVVDLAFCFLKETSDDILSSAWKSQRTRSLQLDDGACELLENVFFYFSRRTNGNCHTGRHRDSQLNLLFKHEFEHYFTRSVINLLVCDPDKNSKQVKEIFPLSLEESKKCDNCGRHYNDIKRCSKCRNSKYCSKPCQYKHWKFHKADCKKLLSTPTLMSKPTVPKSAPDCSTSKTCFIADCSLRLFPLARYWYSGDFRFYYAYGNTPAEDFLENCAGVKEPEVLLLGCGDIRSCFYSIWKNFDSSIPKPLKRFDGVHFVLNDCCAAVLARNIVFLHLCLQLPDDTVEKKNWLSAMWAIWYSHELYPQHQKVLNDSLKLLLRFSESLDAWDNSENPLQHLIKFTSSTTLAEICHLWNIWLERKVEVASVYKMHLSRSKELMNRGVPQEMELYAYSYSCNSVFVNGNSEDDIARKISIRKPEVILYTKSGNSFAENVLNIEYVEASTSPNLTLYERSDGVYTLHYGSMPFSGYHHTLEFSPHFLKSIGIDKKICDEMLVGDKSFKSHPFLANSVQQFIMWIQSASRVLKGKDSHVSFSFNSQHALSFCQDLQNKSKCIGSSVNCNKYDLIYTSNLSDHLGLPNVVLSAIPLLKPAGKLFTATLLYRNYTKTVDDFLKLCFGFDCKMLPLILGCRCINHEGTGYANPVMIRPRPMSAIEMINVQKLERVLIWENVSSQSLTLSQLPKSESGNITDALFDLVHMTTSPLIESPNGYPILNNICIETAICVLHSFISSTTTKSDNFHFWEPLSSLLNRMVAVKPFLYGIQTQALLHDLHIHLTVSESDCPLCKNAPIEDTIGLFCAEIPLPIHHLSPNFMALVHKYTSSDAQYLCNEAKSGKDVHIIDCMDGTIEKNILKLNFYAPLKFIAQSYRVTLALSLMIFEKNTIIPVDHTMDITDMSIPYMKYSFLKPIHSLQSSSSCNSLGVLTSHVCEADEARSEITLYDSSLEAKTSNKFNVKKVSSNAIELSCGLHHTCCLKFHYPIDYDRVMVTISKKGKVAKILCPRRAHQFEEEGQVFIVSPDHQLFLPPQHVSANSMVCFTGMQTTEQEYQFTQSINMNHALKPALLNVKETFMILFQSRDVSYFQTKSPEYIISGYIVINHHQFDYNHKTPALDLAFHFVDNSDAKIMLPAWNRLVQLQKVQDIIVDNAEYPVLKKCLFYFAKRTNGSCQTARSNSQLSLLCREKIDKYFTRAVVYLLYCDPDQKGVDLVNAMPTSNNPIAAAMLKHLKTEPSQSGNPNIDEKCDYCGKHFPDTKKCSKCRKVQYCSKDCQTKHWQVHSSKCQVTTASRKKKSSTKFNRVERCDSDMASEKLHKCSNCGETPPTLKKCTRCGKAQYCGKTCQTSHWPVHKQECKMIKEGEDPSTTTNKPMPPFSPGSVGFTKPESCSYCGCSSTVLMKCGRCGRAKYCGKKCQKGHWAEHKHICK